jgi:hypothetical protein
MTNPDDRPPDPEIVSQVLYGIDGKITKDPKKAVTGNATIRYADGSIENVRLVTDRMTPEEA